MGNELMPIQKMIFTVRGKKVMLDSDLAFLYEVEVKQLNRAVRRNSSRFPEDFMFQLTKEEFAEMVTNYDHLNQQTQKFRSNMPYAFTEQGVAMLAGVLNSQQAIDINIQIMRTFTLLRSYILSNESINEQITELRKLLMLYIDKNDKRVNDIILALNNLLEKPKNEKVIVGFSKDY